jgi:hypothetical protein
VLGSQFSWGWQELRPVKTHLLKFPTLSNTADDRTPLGLDDKCRSAIP